MNFISNDGKSEYCIELFEGEYTVYKLTDNEFKYIMASESTNEIRDTIGPDCNDVYFFNLVEPE